MSLNLTKAEAAVLLDVLAQRKLDALEDLLTVSILAAPTKKRRETLTRINAKFKNLEGALDFTVS